MKEREERQKVLPPRRELHQHEPAVVLGSNPPDEAAGLHAIHEFHGAVVLDLQALRQDTDRRLPTLWHALQGEEQLVLLWFKARRAGGSFAEMQEAATFIAKLGQRLILHGGELFGGHAVRLYRVAIGMPSPSTRTMMNLASR